MLSDNSPVSLLVLTDEDEKKQMSVMCNDVMRWEFGVRRGKYTGNDEERCHVTETLSKSLPETLAAMIHTYTDLQLAVVIVSVYDGEYQTVLTDEKSGVAMPIKVSEGALLCYADPSIPLYIERSLWEHQCSDYTGVENTSIAIPLNTLPLSMLKAAMKKSISEENYEMAQKVQ